MAGDRAPSGATGRRRRFLRVETWRSASPFGGWMARGRGASFGLHRSQMRPISIVPLRGNGSGGTGSAAVFGLPASRNRRALTFGWAPTSVVRSQTKPRLFASPTDSRVRGRRSGLEPPGETSSESRAAHGKYGAAASERVRSRSPWEHRAVRSGNAAWPQRTLRWNKALRSRLGRRSVATRKRVRAERREGTPAGERNHTREGVMR